MKRKINILIPIFVVLVLVYVLRSVFGSHVQIETLHQSSIEDMVNTKGVVIKYESALAQGVSGTLEPAVLSGTRVAAGQEVATVYSGEVDSELKNRLEQVHKKISQIEKNRADLTGFSGDISRLEQQITAKTNELIEKSLNGDMAGVAEIQFVIESLCEKKSQVAGNTAADNTLDELYAQKAELEGRIGAVQHSITAPFPGVFSVACDGYEALVTPYNMTELAPSSLSNLLAQENKPQEDVSGCKIMQNYRYFIAINLPIERLNGLQIDSSVRLRFYDLFADLIHAKVQYISPEEEGECTVILEVNQHVDALLERRFVNLDFVKSRYEGYRVSVKSLRTKDNVNGVYVRRDGAFHFIPVNILYNTQDVAIVESADKTLPLRLYDEVVISGGKHEEGKPLQ